MENEYPKRTFRCSATVSPRRDTAFCDDSPEGPSRTVCASGAVVCQVVARAKQLEVVQVIHHRHAVPFQFPENRWRKMVIVRPEARPR